MKISESYIGFFTNNEKLIQKDKFYWFDANFLDMKFVEINRSKDSFFKILDQTSGKTLEQRAIPYCLEVIFPLLKPKNMTKDMESLVI